MACLATDAKPNQGGRIRRGLAPSACFVGNAESFRFLSQTWTNSFCNWTDQRWFTLATGIHPGQQTEGVDFWPEKFLPVSSFRAVNLPKCGGYPRRFLAHL